VSQYSAVAQAKGANLGFSRYLCRARTISSPLQHDQAASAYRHLLRQTRSQLPRFRHLAAIPIWLRVYESAPYLDQNDKSNRLVTGADVLK
jgi:hypothetical protein